MSWEDAVNRRERWAEETENNIRESEARENAQCGNCRFWEVMEGFGEESREIGLCKRYPPMQPRHRADPDGWLFPEVPENEWCGEWRGK